MTNPEKIYHYCSLKTAIEFILPSKQLLINSLGKSNDPRENKSYNFGVARQNTIGSDLNIWRFNENLSVEIRKQTKMTCFSSDNGIVKGYGHSRMWALYGENHKGVCLEIDEQEFMKENAELINEGYFEKMNYDDINSHVPGLPLVQYESLILNDMEKFLSKFKRENVDFLFFRKNSEWESEMEKRLIIFSNNVNPEYCSIKNSLKKVILGIDFNENYFPSILHFCDEIEIRKLGYWNYNLYLKDKD